MNQSFQPLYFLDIQGQTAGPFSIKQVSEMLKSKEITFDTIFAVEGCSEWQPVSVICPINLAPERIKVVPGSDAITLVLVLFFLIPGIIYMLWRNSSQKTVCRSCKSDAIIPASSPRAMEYINKLNV